VARKVLPSVVTISATNGTTSQVGSGEVVASNGNILTNDHVIAVAAVSSGKVTVMLADGRTLPASIRGRDPQTDLSVIKVTASETLPAVTYGSGADVQLGEPVVAVGAPLGLAGSVTAGIVSGLDRSVTLPTSDGTTATLISALQTDASINPGNSGGTLADCAGELVGVPTAIATIPDESGAASGGSIGIGFAIPAEVAKAVADQLIASGKVAHSYLGVSVLPTAPSQSSSGSATSGLQITALDPAGPSTAAGLKVGDVITHIDGAPATDADQLAMITITKPPGTKVTLTYLRAGTAATATVTLATPPAS
jgi:putative serine protease PepD